MIEYGTLNTSSPPLSTPSPSPALARRSSDLLNMLDDSSENGGRLDNSRSNDDSLLTSNGSPNREHYSRVNDDLWMKLKDLPGGAIMSRIGKLHVLNTEIAKGSNGTIVFEGCYENRRVAVKRLVKGHHDNRVVNEIENLIKSDLHKNIVRYHGVEKDQHFVYLALERCACNLDDLIQAASTVGYESKLDSVRDLMQDVKLRRPDGHPSPFLLDLMRDVVSGLAYLHGKKIIHRDLKPQNVLITENPSLGAKLCDMGISRCLPQDESSLGPHATTGCGTSGWQAPEQLRGGSQTRAMDMFSLGCVLFFCVTGGGHPFGEYLGRDMNIMNDKMDLSLVESIPEAHDLISRLLNPDPKLRPKSSDVLRHPLFWSSQTRLSFLCETSDRVQEDVSRAIKSYLLNELESKAPLVFAGNWDSESTKKKKKYWNGKIDPVFMAEIYKGRLHTRYDYSRVRDLLRVVRNKLNHYRELPENIKELVGPVPEGYDNYFAERFPGLLMLSYKVVYQFCKKEEWFQKYFWQ